MGFLPYLFTRLDWPRILERYARYVNPLLKSLLHGYQHYWVTSQSEYATDIIFKSSSDLCEGQPNLEPLSCTQIDCQDTAQPQVESN
jgi:hypothetical protein